MLYIRDDIKLTDLQLCKLWFLCLYKDYSLPENLTEIHEDLLENNIILQRVSSYKLVDREIFKAGSSWFVGDGFGNIVYSPNRFNSDFRKYKDGELPIAEKYNVYFKEFA